MHGDFIWYELMTPDADASRDFYSKVVGWTIGASEGTPGYAIVTGSEGDVGGMLTLSAEMQQNGAKAAWLGYVAVNDVDDMITAIEHGGGKVMVPATDIPQGRFAMVSDPQGATFYVMTPTPPPGEEDKQSIAFSYDKKRDGHCAWNELWTSDAAAALKFYGSSFGWVEDSAMDMGPAGKYHMIRHRELIGGMAGVMPGQPPGWTYYFRVPSIPAAVEIVKQQGGTVVMGPHEIPGGDHIIIGVDPQGAQFALVGNKE